MDPVHKFGKIRRKYDELFKDSLRDGNLPMRSTEYGFWGAASPFNVFEFFRKINLSKYDKFLDLGSGDGRVVLIASLFTDAIGIEGDPDLVKQSEKIMDELGVEAGFECGDYMEHDFSRYDVLFIYPDKSFSDELVKKIRKEFSGHLYVYNKIYLPYGLEKGRTIWVEQMPVVKYEV